MLVREASKVWSALNGIVCLYKPADVTCYQMRETLLKNICKELCEMDCRPPRDHVFIEGDPAKELTVRAEPSYADHPLLVGPRYQPQDIRCNWGTFLNKQTSVFGLREGTKTAYKLSEVKPTRAYRIKGLLGAATDNCFSDGKILVKSKFKHVRLKYIEQVLCQMQAAHQKKMFELCGVSLQSQEAYDLAVQGPIRPAMSELPVIYGIKCVEFKSPNFVIEVQCVNEYEDYLKLLIHEIGLQVHSNAYCTGIQCIRHSYFTLQHALLKKHWTLQNIVDNMRMCREIMNEHDILVNQTVALR